jgi:hypothetical protein
LLETTWFQYSCRSHNFFPSAGLEPPRLSFTVPPYEDVAAGRHNGPHHLLAADLIARGFGQRLPRRSTGWFCYLPTTLLRQLTPSPPHCARLRRYLEVWGLIVPRWHRFSRIVICSRLQILFRHEHGIAAPVALRGPFLSRSQDCPYCDFALMQRRPTGTRPR